MSDPRTLRIHETACSRINNQGARVDVGLDCDQCRWEGGSTIHLTLPLAPPACEIPLPEGLDWLRDASLVLNCADGPGVQPNDWHVDDAEHPTTLIATGHLCEALQGQQSDTNSLPTVERLDLIMSGVLPI